MFSRREVEEKQGEFWIERSRVSKPTSQGFYSKLNEHLAAMDFARQIWALCAPGGSPAKPRPMRATFWFTPVKKPTNRFVAVTRLTCPARGEVGLP